MASGRPFTINGVEYVVTVEQVERAMHGAPTLPIPPGGWWCRVKGRRHPVKTVVTRTLGLPGRSYSRDHALAFCRHVGLPFDQEPGVYRPEKKVAPKRGE